MCSPHAPLCASRPPHFVSVHSCVFVCSLSVDLRPTDPTAFSTSCRGECRTSLGAEKEGGNELSVNWTKLRGPSLPPRCQTRCCPVRRRPKLTLSKFTLLSEDMLGVGAHERRMFTPPQPPQKTTLFQRHAHFRGAVRTVFAGPLRPTGAEPPRAHNLRTIQPTYNQKRIHNQKRSLLDTQRWNTYTYITSYICQSDTPPKQ